MDKSPENFETLSRQTDDNLCVRELELISSCSHSLGDGLSNLELQRSVVGCCAHPWTMNAGTEKRGKRRKHIYVYSKT